MPDSIALAVLGRYLDGIASPEERAAVESWISADADRQAAVAELRAAWTADARRLGAPFDREAAWAHLSRRLSAHATPRLYPTRSVIRVGARAAGIAIMLAASGAAWLALHSRRAKPAATAAAPAVREYATPRGQRALFRLLDGTEITLNADSRLRVPATFGATRRDVYLDGEAYFTVVHDSARPFAVHTARGVTRDIGTRFNISAYQGDATERVAVAEGAVTVRAATPSREVPLEAGQVATLSPARGVTIAASASLARELAWTNGRLEFDAVPLAQAARSLGRWYDIEVRVTDSVLARRRVTGSYGNEPVANVITVIAAAVGARHEWQGRKVTMFPTRGAP